MYCNGLHFMLHKIRSTSFSRTDVEDDDYDMALFQVTGMRIYTHLLLGNADKKDSYPVLRTGTKDRT